MAFLCIFQCLPLLLPSFFSLPLFSLSSLVRFFLPSCFLCFLLSFIFSFLLWICFMKTTTSNIKLERSFSSLFSVSFGLPILLCLSNPCFLSLLFPYLKLGFWFTSFFSFKKRQLIKHQFWVKSGAATRQVFLISCVFPNMKSYLFWGPMFGQNSVDVQKNFKNR